MTECLMDNMHRPGNDIRSINNIGSYNECKDKCIEDEECYTWTHMEGTCYLKNENTFKGHGDNVMSGMRNCSNAGKTLIHYTITFIQCNRPLGQSWVSYFYLLIIECISNGLDYNGGDIWKDRSSTVENCGKQCIENDECGKWTFVVPGNNGTCVLKRNSSDFIIPCLECISGFRSTPTTSCEDQGY